jgi:uncharacterized membrane protein
VHEAAVPATKVAGTFVTIDFPGSCGTVLEGINSRGEIIGAYIDCVNPYPFNGHNFLWNNGTFTDIDPPGCLGDGNFASTEMGINEQGDVVGTCIDSTGFYHGFRLSNGSYTLLDAPGSIGGGGTAAAGINPKGDIIGWFFDNSSFNAHGFLVSNGTYTTIDVPAALAPAPAQTQTTAINPQGDILGTYQDERLSYFNQGFLLSGGVFSGFNIPGGPAIFPNGMNPRGDIVGGVCCGTGPSGAFLLSHGTVTIFDAPGACSGCTLAFGINAEGDIVGEYGVNAVFGHGFLLKKH